LPESIEFNRLEINRKRSLPVRDFYYQFKDELSLTLRTPESSLCTEIIVRVLDKTICVRAEEDNMYKAIDAMLDRVERQLKKENEKLKVHKSVPASVLAG